MLELNRSNESGRSMVEMLGVLAIIGVLSVGGIAGYTTAMNSHRANEAVNNATRLAMLLSSKRLLNSEATLSADELAGTGFGITQNANEIILSVDVPEAVKTKIAGMGLTVASLDTATQGKITFTFNNDLSERISGSQAGGNSTDSEQQQGQQQGTQTPSDPCANVTCQHGGTCSNGSCDCTGTGYDGTYCNLKTFSCNDISATSPVKDSNGTLYGYCQKLGGCKVENASAEKWSELCYQQLADGYYVCTLAVVFDTEGNQVGQCAEGCQPGPADTIDGTCISAGPGGPAPI